MNLPPDIESLLQDRLEKLSDLAAAKARLARALRCIKTAEADQQEASVVLAEATHRDRSDDGKCLSQALGTMKARVRQAVEWNVELHLAAHAVNVGEVIYRTATIAVENAIGELDGADRAQAELDALAIGG